MSILRSKDKFKNKILIFLTIKDLIDLELKAYPKPAIAYIDDIGFTKIRTIPNIKIGLIVIA